MALLAQLETPALIAVVAGAGVVGAIAGFVLRRFLMTAALSRAQGQAQETIAHAESQARLAAEKIRVEAEKALLERRREAERDLEQARETAREAERRLGKREDQLERREETLKAKEAAADKAAQALKQQEDLLSKRGQELTEVLQKQRDKLVQLTGLPLEEARRELMLRVEEDARLDIAKAVRKIEEEAERKAQERAREITLMAVQRYAGEHTSESTVRSVAIPSDDMKGRIIGREGRNIRAIEKATGVDIIVDDTPGVIVVSCFDKVRQAIAVESLERLIADGRMHPARIEEIVAKVRSEIQEKIVKAGRDAVLEVSLRGVHPAISEAMGRLAYRTSYGQNVLRHSVEVAFLSQIIADQLGLDGTLARRCGFLHDIGKAMDHEMEGGHPKIGMEFARQHGEKEPVLNAIGGHHADIPSTSFYTPIVMAADAISGARPGARRESMEKYVQRLTELQNIALAQSGVNEAYAIQAGREVRVMVDASKVGDDEAYLIAQKIAQRVSQELTFPGEIKVTVLRETRAIEYAR